jgi:hypothetical protein
LVGIVYTSMSQNMWLITGVLLQVFWHVGTNLQYIWRKKSKLKKHYFYTICI